MIPTPRFTLRVNTQPAGSAPPPALRPDTRSEVFKCFLKHVGKVLVSHGQTLFLVHLARDVALQAYDNSGGDPDHLGPSERGTLAALNLATLAYDLTMIRGAIVALHAAATTTAGVTARSTPGWMHALALLPTALTILGTYLALQEAEGGARKAYDLQIMMLAFRMFRPVRDGNQQGEFGGLSSPTLVHVDGSALTAEELAATEPMRLKVQWAMYTVASFFAIVLAAPSLREVVGEASAERGPIFAGRALARLASFVSLVLEMADEASPFLSRRYIQSNSRGELRLRITEGGRACSKDWTNRALVHGRMRALFGLGPTDMQAAIAGLVPGSKLMTVFAQLVAALLNGNIEARGKLAEAALAALKRRETFENFATEFVTAIEDATGCMLADEDRERIKQTLHGLLVTYCTEGGGFDAGIAAFEGLGPQERIAIARDALEPDTDGPRFQVSAGEVPQEPSADDAGAEFHIPNELFLEMFAAGLSGAAGPLSANDEKGERPHAAAALPAAGAQLSLPGTGAPWLVTGASAHGIHLRRPAQQPLEVSVPMEAEGPEHIRRRRVTAASQPAPLLDLDCANVHLPLRPGTRFTLGKQQFQVMEVNKREAFIHLLLPQRGEDIDPQLLELGKSRRFAKHPGGGREFTIPSGNIPKLQELLARTAPIAVGRPGNSARGSEDTTPPPSDASTPDSTVALVKDGAGHTRPPLRIHDRGSSLMEAATAGQRGSHLVAARPPDHQQATAPPPLLDPEVSPVLRFQTDLAVNPRLLFGRHVVGVEFDADDPTQCWIRCGAAIPALGHRGGLTPVRVDTLLALTQQGRLLFGPSAHDFLRTLEEGEEVLYDRQFGNQVVRWELTLERIDLLPEGGHLYHFVPAGEMSMNEAGARPEPFALTDTQVREFYNRGQLHTSSRDGYVI